MSPVLALHKYTLLSKATASTFPELQSTRFRSARGKREEHELSCWLCPSLSLFLHPLDKEKTALNSSHSGFQGHPGCGLAGKECSGKSSCWSLVWPSGYRVLLACSGNLWQQNGSRLGGLTLPHAFRQEDQISTSFPSVLGGKGRQPSHPP